MAKYLLASPGPHFVSATGALIGCKMPLDVRGLLHADNVWWEGAVLQLRAPQTLLMGFTIAARQHPYPLQSCPYCPRGVSPPRHPDISLLGGQGSMAGTQ